MSTPAKRLTTAQRIEALEQGQALDESPLDGFPPSPWASGQTISAPITVERVKTVVADYFLPRSYDGDLRLQAHREDDGGRR